MIIAIPGFVLAALILATLREPVRAGSAGATDDGDTSLRAVIGHLLSQKSYVFILLAICLSLLVEFGLNQWLPSYYVRQFGLTMSEVGYCYGLAVAAGGIPGSIMGGLVASRLCARTCDGSPGFPRRFTRSHCRSASRCCWHPLRRRPCC